MSEVAFQDRYPDDVAHCYGCGRLNPEGLHVRTFWDGEQTVSRLTPDARYTAMPGYVYGGLVASLIDCHGTGSASGATARRDALSADDPTPRFVTASLHVDYRKPTPMGVELVARGTIAEITDRKVIVDVTVNVDDVTVATGRVIAVRMPAHLIA